MNYLSTLLNEMLFFVSIKERVGFEAFNIKLPNKNALSTIVRRIRAAA